MALLQTLVLRSQTFGRNYRMTLPAESPGPGYQSGPATPSWVISAPDSALETHEIRAFCHARPPFMSGCTELGSPGGTQEAVGRSRASTGCALWAGGLTVRLAQVRSPGGLRGSLPVPAPQALAVRGGAGFGFVLLSLCLCLFYSPPCPRAGM